MGRLRRLGLRVDEKIVRSLEGRSRFFEILLSVLEILGSGFSHFLMVFEIGLGQLNDFECGFKQVVGPAFSLSCGVLVVESLSSVGISGIFLGSRKLEGQGSLSEGSAGLGGLFLLVIHYLDGGKYSIGSSQLLGLDLLEVVSDGDVSVGDFQQDGACIKWGLLLTAVVGWTLKVK